MKMVAFRKMGWLYKPVSILGWIILIAAVVFLVSVYTTYNKHAHGFEDLAYKIYPHYIATFLLYQWIAHKSSK